MSRPIDELSGWLKTFQVTNLLTLFFLPITVIYFVFLYSYNKTTIPLAIILVLIGELGVYWFITYKILKCIKLRSEDVPNMISKLLLSLVIVSDGFLAIKHLIDLDLTMNSVKVLVSEVLYFFGWAMYFEKSKRVKAYYGANTKLSFL
ncbi:MAG TPA: hypothetical protein ENI73_10760 [Spirochaetes bacterium]|nr:hypothetical protein [Spirochaetota bacterium]